MQYARGQVKAEFFDWNDQKKHYLSIGKKYYGKSLSDVLRDVIYVDCQIIIGTEHLVLFYAI